MIEAQFQIVMPDFKCTIPMDILEGFKNKRERQVLETLNIMAQQQEWTVHSIAEMRRLFNEQKETVELVQKLRLIYFSKWSPFFWIALTSAPWLITKGLSYLWK